MRWIGFYLILDFLLSLKCHSVFQGIISNEPVFRLFEFVQGALHHRRHHFEESCLRFAWNIAQPLKHIELQDRL